MDLSKLSLSDLRALGEQVKQELLEREHAELAQAREQIMAIAQRVGISLEELIKDSARAKVLKVAKIKGKAAVRYRHPSNTAMEWTGRGRQPQWVKDWVASGQPVNALRV
jgi:DNA-binding protein H-NS